MSKPILADVTGFFCSSEQEIRESVQKQFGKLNGDYIVEICKRCGNAWMDQDGFSEKATIKDVCNRCFEFSNEQVLEYNRSYRI